jgi:hypothetical protein
MIGADDLRQAPQQRCCHRSPRLRSPMIIALCISQTIYFSAGFARASDIQLLLRNRFDVLTNEHIQILPKRIGCERNFAHFLSAG